MELLALLHAGDERIHRLSHTIHDRPFWDLIVLTATDKEQAESYQCQITAKADTLPKTPYVAVLIAVFLLYYPKASMRSY